MRVKIFLLFLFLLGLQRGIASDYQGMKVQADSLYKEGNYHGAIFIYENILKKKYNADIFYNLGNAYYKKGDLGHAILNYERAYKVDPSNNDIRYNLLYARSKVKGQKIETHTFVKDLVRAVGYRLNVQQWMMLSLTCLIILIISFFYFYFGKNNLFRKVSLTCMCGSSFLFLLGVFGQKIQRSNWLRNNEAIIIKSSPITDSPNSSTNLTTVAQGTKVTIIGTQGTNWYNVECSDKVNGWIQKDKIEKI